MTKKKSNKSAIRTDKDKEVARRNRAIYSATDPTLGYPKGLGLLSVPFEGAHDYKTPLNVLQNYTIQYDPKSNSMKYRDTYDFNGFESFVPGEPFEISGSIPLNKFYDGGLKVEMPDFSNLKLEAPKLTEGLKSTISTLGNKIGGFASSLGGDVIGGLGQAVGVGASSLIGGGLSSGAGNAITGVTGTIGGALSKVNPLLGGAVSAIGGIVGGLTNRAFGSKLNKEKIAGVEGDISQAMNFVSNAGDWDSLASNYAELQGVQGFNKESIGKDGWFSNKAKKKYNSLKTQAEEAEQFQMNTLENNAQNIADAIQQTLLANYSAYGGPIHIKPSKKGTFTAAANKKGMGVQEFASKVLANKEDYSPAMVKKANFARNASKWKHADGGPLGEENLSLEDFIAQKINEKRAAALDKSRNRTSVRIPMVPNKRPIDVWEGLLNNNIEYTEESLSRAMAEGNKKLAALRQEELDSYLKEKDKGYPKLVPGANCMYNAGDCYGLNIPGNQTFVAKHKELGFKKAPKGSMEPGDIVQDVRGGTPIHAMIYDGKDTEGNLLFNYARGNGYADLENGYVKQGNYPLPIKDFDVYKYVGTPADSTQWINEYKEMYNNKKAEGGSLFTNGVITVGNGGTHEYLEGQEYDVTEEEIKLLKKLGYEFEYL